MRISWLKKVTPVYFTIVAPVQPVALPEPEVVQAVELPVVVTPVEEAPVQEAPVEEAPVEEAPVEEESSEQPTVISE